MSRAGRGRFGQRSAGGPLVADVTLAAHWRPDFWLNVSKCGHMHTYTITGIMCLGMGGRFATIGPTVAQLWQMCRPEATHISNNWADSGPVVANLPPIPKHIFPVIVDVCMWPHLETFSKSRAASGTTATSGPTLGRRPNRRLPTCDNFVSRGGPDFRPPVTCYLGHISVFATKVQNTCIC